MKFRLPRLPKFHVSKKVLIVAGAFVVVVTVAIIFLVLLLNSIARQQNVNQNLSYSPIVPSDKQASKIGTWEKSPTGGDIYVYVDSISGTVISVSEQQLPSSFTSDTDNKMATFAKAQNATTTLAAGNVTLYLGLSAKGPQSAIFTKSNLLVLIKSSSKISNDAWITYVKSLK